MNALVTPSPLSGTVRAIPSKSEAHRALICAALSDKPTRVVCRSTSEDIDATLGCLAALGAHIERDGESYLVHPIEDSQMDGALLDCHESGSTLRFLLPVAATMGSCTFTGAGRLSKRPMEPLADTLRAHGATIDADDGLPVHVRGPLAAGRFDIPGNISSQFITGLLLAAPLLNEPVEIRVSEPIESRPYIDLSLSVIHAFGIDIATIHENGFTSYRVPEQASYRSPGNFEVGGDWSNAAFWLSAGALSDEGVAVEGLSLSSKQADRVVAGALALLGAQVMRNANGAAARRGDLHGARIDVSSCPDLVPAIAPVSALAKGRTTICGASRLRLKESDRLAAIADVLGTLGANVCVDDDALVFEGVEHLHGGTVDAHNDHRIAMMAAIAATRAADPVHIFGAECVAKSYPGFFDDFAKLGGLVMKEV